MANYIDPNDRLETNDLELDTYSANDDQTPLLNLSTGITQHTTDFTEPKSSQELELIRSYKDTFKSWYGIDDKTFDVLRMNLSRRGNELYFKSNKGDVLISGALPSSKT